MNLELFRLINNLAYKNHYIDLTMIIFSKYVPIIFMAIIAIMYIGGFIKNNPKMRGVAVSTIILTIINLFIAFIIGTIYYVPRPFVTSKVNLIYPHIDDASLPSDHAIGTMSIALGIYGYKEVYGCILIFISLMVGASRVYVGHHYPLDVIVAYLITFITNSLYGKLVRDKVQKLYFTIERRIMG